MALIIIIRDDRVCSGTIVIAAGLLTNTLSAARYFASQIQAEVHWFMRYAVGGVASASGSQARRYPAMVTSLANTVSALGIE